MINKLLKLNRQILHTSDLGLIWGITNKNTLYTTIKRYVDRGILLPVQKGLYTTIPLSRLDPVALGVSFLHTYAYLSCESVLAEKGIIAQVPQAITLVSAVTKKFTIGETNFICRRLKPTFLYQTAGIISAKGYLTATTERAVADLIYFNRHYYFDNPKLINWPTVKFIQKEVGYL